MNILDLALSIAARRDFPRALHDSASKMLELNTIAPRTARYVSNVPNWLMTQGAVLLYFEHLRKKSAPNLTSANLLKLFAAHEVSAVSKNTIVSHLGEMRRYGLVSDDKTNTGKRAKPLLLSETGQELVCRWFNGHLMSLDMMDGGTRHERSLNEPELLYRAHPRAVRILLGEKGWSDPPDSVGTFAWVESGSNILHDLFLRTPPQIDLPDRIWVGSISASDITGAYIISRSHAQRVFARAKERQLLGWERSGNGGSLWISRDLIESYRLWQALKFAAIQIAWSEIEDSNT
ncbi:hypothetical protein [Agrobacterium tumefaciens]|uniref:hypothetical protein n=1 Tax=Agrobacterium tumefaciens TaxID=358 RepID=UPI00287DEBE6|nr:hypothetical protein [Agrobacterium tumefaciens]MDS7594912.1 hypothetical protein [Agrobacterium tumefaciens]